MSDPLELGRLTDRRPPFKYSALARVWFSDTDAQGVVYYGRYLPYFDHARTEYHRHLGGLATPGREFVMRASDVEYHAPARFDDLIEAFVRVSRIGRSSVTYECAAYRLPDDTLMVTAQQTLVLVDAAARRPVAGAGRAPDGSSSIRGRRSRRMSAGSEDAVRQVVAEGGEADDILRASVAALTEQADVAWAGIAFLDGGVLGLGPTAGMADESRRTRTPILFQGALVGELWVDGERERAELEQDRRARRPVRADRLGHGRRGLGSIGGPSLDRGTNTPIEGVPRSRDCIPQRREYKEIGERGREPRARPRTGARHDPRPPPVGDRRSPLSFRRSRIRECGFAIAKIPEAQPLRGCGRSEGCCRARTGDPRPIRGADDVGARPMA